MVDGQLPHIRRCRGSHVAVRQLVERKILCIGNGERGHSRPGGHNPAAGYVDVPGAIAIGAVSGVICYLALLFRVGRGLDESCDAWAVHGMGGLWGAIATGILATTSIKAIPA